MEPELFRSISRSRSDCGDGQKVYQESRREKYTWPRPSETFSARQGPRKNVAKDQEAPGLAPESVTSDGEQTIDFKFDDARQFSESLAPVASNGKWGYVDSSGTFVIPISFEDAQPFKQSLAAAKDSTGKYGFIDRKGTWRISPAFRYAYAFSEGMANVQDFRGKQGAIGTTGKLIVPLEYDRLDAFRDGFAYWEKGATFGYVDKNGVVVWDGKINLEGEIKMDALGLTFVPFPKSLPDSDKSPAAK